MILTHEITNSSMLVRISYNHGVLEVGFRNGKHYSYKDVPMSVYLEFKNAESAGTYYNSHIKQQYERLNTNNPDNTGSNAGTDSQI